MKKFRTCVIGVGFIGAAHIEALRRLGNVDVVAISDIPNAVAKAAAHCVPKGYDDYKEMIDVENLTSYTSARRTPRIMRWPCTPWSAGSPLSAKSL